MFAQVIQGRAKDPAGLRKQLERWNEEIRPGSIGFLGSTGGVSDDGEFIMVARFQDEARARQNSDRSEQGEWWSETEKYIDGDARFYDSTDVAQLLDGGSDDAGFVQVIQGTAKDRRRLEAAEKEDEGWLRRNRPEVIGGTTVWQGNDFTQVVYFTSEGEAREGEKKVPDGDPPPVVWSAMVDNMKFIDLREPWMV